ncbi:MAG: ComF family protein [Desulfobacteraceae bacterium]|nr:ComF family protein [Desulfobacteraceae bacterium]
MNCWSESELQDNRPTSARQSGKSISKVRLRCVAPKKIREKTVLLIDDVYTTGTTVSECAKALLHSGAKQVDVLTLAKAVLHEA